MSDMQEINDMRLMFAVAQPPHKGPRPLDRDYIRMAKMCIMSLLKTGFPKEKIIIVTASKEHSEGFRNRFGIDARTCDHIPKEFRKIFKKSSKKYYFFKPVAYYNCVREAVSDDTVMCFNDVDALFKRNPHNFLKKIKTDVWAAEGVILPRRRKEDLKVYNPTMKYDSLKEFYWESGSGSMAYLHLLYKWPLQHQVLFAGSCAIRGNVYAKLIERWYEMSSIVVQREDQRKGDQEVLSAAIWSLGLSHGRSKKGLYRRRYCQQYEAYKKGRMKKDFNRLKL